VSPYLGPSDGDKKEADGKTKAKESPCFEAPPDVLAAIGLKFLQYRKPDPEAD